MEAARQCLLQTGMMRVFLLDTNAASAVIQQHEVMRAHIMSHPPDSLHISVITAAELRHGIERRPEAVNLRRRVHAFLARISILPFVDEDSTAFARLRVLSSKQGKTLSDLDMLIAAHAYSRDMTLVTADRAFMHIPHLRLVDWTR